MATHLHIEGPFDMGYESNGRAKQIRKSDATDFWNSPKVKHLKRKQGCYIFAMRAGQGYTPWYVGKASKGFDQESFTDHKRNHYNKALFSGKKGSPVLFFVCPQDKKKKVPASVLTEMEKELIQYALTKNPDLCNIQGTRNPPQWTIKGVIRSGRGRSTAAADRFKKMMKM